MSCRDFRALARPMRHTHTMNRTRIALAGLGIVSPRLLSAAERGTRVLAAAILAGGVLVTAVVGMAPLLIAAAGFHLAHRRAAEEQS
jgi:hypothetical protein